jgi:hypothetical protein
VAPFPSRYVEVDAARARFGDRVDRIGAFLDRVDPLADAVVDDLETLGHGPGFAMIERALRRGIAAVPSAPASFRALFGALDDRPAWVDDGALDRGGALLMRAGILGGIVLGAKSLVHGYATPGGNKPLVFSGRLVEGAARRLNETSRFVQAVCRPGGMRRHGDGFEITVKVRLIHAQVRRMCLRSGRWDRDRWGAPINQHDMAGTTLLFSLSVLEGLATLGLSFDRDEAEDYLHLWRYVGHVIGVDPAILPTSHADAWRLARVIDATTGPPDDDSRTLVRALFEHPRTIAKTEAERRRAEVQVGLGQAFGRLLVGQELADRLAIPTTPWRHLLPAIRTFAAASEAVRRRMPSATQAAIEAGTRYWDRVVAIGLAEATAEFRPPERLADLRAEG